MRWLHYLPKQLTAVLPEDCPFGLAWLGVASGVKESALLMYASHCRGHPKPYRWLDCNKIKIYENLAQEVHHSGCDVFLDGFVVGSLGLGLARMIGSAGFLGLVIDTLPQWRELRCSILSDGRGAFISTVFPDSSV